MVGYNRGNKSTKLALSGDLNLCKKNTKPACAGWERENGGYGNPPYLAGMETRPTWRVWKPALLEQVAALSGAARVEIEHNRFMGIGNQINVALKAESLVDRDERRAALTSAWFEDLRTFESIMLISFDTFEQATSEFRDWISGHLSRTRGFSRALAASAGFFPRIRGFSR